MTGQACCVTRYCSGVSSDTASGFLLYVFIFRTPLQARYKYDRETPWPVLATRPTMIHEESQNRFPVLPGHHGRCDRIEFRSSQPA